MEVKSDDRYPRGLDRIVRLIVIVGLLAIPAAILARGYRPFDDALRHVGKAVSGKPWTEVIVTLESNDLEFAHVGWYSILGALHRRAGLSADELVSFSVLSLFAAFGLSAICFARRAESCSLTLLVLSLTHPEFKRLMLGRPFILSMAATVVILFLWPRLRRTPVPRGTLVLIVALVTASVWIHTNWYLFVLLPVAFLLAREWRAGALILACVVAGILLGASLSGHPVGFLVNTFVLNFYSVGPDLETTHVVSEFQPFDGDVLTVGAVILLLIWRRLRGEWSPGICDNPLISLAVVCWACAFSVGRFWYDWGMPAVAVWMVREFDDAIDSLRPGPACRLFVSVFASVTLFLNVSADRGGVWTRSLRVVSLSASNAAQAGWLPGVGGTVYSDSMTVFNRLFFENPHARWRYVLGYETTLMPPADLAVFREILWSKSSFQALRPWIEKMRPEDRLILQGSRGLSGPAFGLEWCDFRSYTVGRIPIRHEGAGGSRPTPRSDRPGTESRAR